jgi:hypothetical protein
MPYNDPGIGYVFVIVIFLIVLLATLFPERME